MPLNKETKRNLGDNCSCVRFSLNTEYWFWVKFKLSKSQYIQGYASICREFKPAHTNVLIHMFMRTQTHITINKRTHIYACIYPNPLHEKDVTRSQILSWVKQVWIQDFLSSRLVAIPRLKNSGSPTIYP